MTRRRLKEIAGLARKRNRDLHNQYLIEGVRAVESAVASRAPLIEVLVSPELRQSCRCDSLLARIDVPVVEVSQEDLSRVADTRTTQGILAVAEIVRSEAASLSGAIVALDGVQDPGNVGNIIRTAAWFGVSGVLVGPDSADPYGPKAVRAAMGGIWDLDVASVAALDDALDQLRQRGVPAFGADLEGQPLESWEPPGEGILVLGSEAYGLRVEVRQRVDQLVRIGGKPGLAGVESLNVTVAAGILLHKWLQ